MPQRHLVAATILFVVAAGAAACGNTGTTHHASKAAFCADNSRLDEVTSRQSSSKGLLSALKANKAAIDNFAQNIPAGSIRTDAERLVDAARSAIATGNTSSFGSSSLAEAGATVDTYCGVQSDGTPLPTNFGAGKGTAFCADEAAISAGVNAADSPAALLAFLKANQAKLNTYDFLAPSDVRGDAQALVRQANIAIAADNGSKFETSAVPTAIIAVDLYCGVNH